MKKIILLSLALILVGCADASPQTNVLKSDGTLQIDQNNIDLGTIPILGGNKEIFFAFWNSGKNTVTILEGSASCMCTTAVIEKKGVVVSPTIKMAMAGDSLPEKIDQTLAPGEEAVLHVTFDPLTHGPEAVGPFFREVILKTNSSKNPELSFRFSGNVVKEK